MNDFVLQDVEYSSFVYSFILDTETRYAEEIQIYLNLYRTDKAITNVLAPVLEEVREYLYWLRWTCWNIANLAPALFQNSSGASERLSLAMLAYAAGRLIDDGLDDHENYKGLHQSLVGVLRDLVPVTLHYAACVQSAFIGFSLFHHALIRMNDIGYPQCAKDVSRLFDVSSTGVLVESFVGRQVDAHLYQQIIRRKAVAYNMILYKPFLNGVDPVLRTRLLKILSGMDELAQILNDYHDWQEDQCRGRMNPLTHGVFTPENIGVEITARLEEIQSAAQLLPLKVRYALGIMFTSLDMSPVPDVSSEV